jgi:hypothetical protein
MGKFLSAPDEIRAKNTSSILTSGFLQRWARLKLENLVIFTQLCYSSHSLKKIFIYFSAKVVIFKIKFFLIHNFHPN